MIKVRAAGKDLTMQNAAKILTPVQTTLTHKLPGPFYSVIYACVFEEMSLYKAHTHTYGNLYVATVQSKVWQTDPNQSNVQGQG